MIKSLCSGCKKKSAPPKWFEEVEKIKTEITQVGGSLKSVQYVCPDCAQLVIYKTLTINYFLLTGVN